MTDTQDLLESSFELNLNNYGPEDVERLNDWAIKAYKALKAAQAEIEAVRKANIDCVNHFDALRIDYEQALARLAELEKQEPVAWSVTCDGQHCGNVYGYHPHAEHEMHRLDGVAPNHARAVEPVYAAAGASPVQPSQAPETWTDDGGWEFPIAQPAEQPSQAGDPDASAKTWCEYVAGIVGCYLGEPVESDKRKAIAGIIERRLWALPMPSGDPTEAQLVAGVRAMRLFVTKNSVKDFRDGFIAAINAKGAK